MVQFARDCRAGRLAAFRQQCRCELLRAIDRRQASELDRPLEVCVFGIMTVVILLRIKPWDDRRRGRNFAGGT